MSSPHWPSASTRVIRLNPATLAAGAAGLLLGTALAAFAASSGPETHTAAVRAARSPAAATPAQATPDAQDPPAAQATPDAPVTPAVPAARPTCPGDDGADKRIQALYVHGDRQPALRVTQRKTFQEYLRQVDAAFVRAARLHSGGVRHPRYLLDPQCRPSVTDVVIPQATLSTVDTITAAIKTLGYNRNDRKYIVWYQMPGCGVGFGVGGDDRPDWFNLYNFGPHYAAIGTDCWSWGATLHELLHTLGAVQASAPHGTKNGHCWEDEDVMCYDDQSLPKGGLQVICPKQKGDDIVGNQIDCNGDDYFNTAPAPGSYLATHWNVASNDFLSH
jgi:hypothetical protein